MTKSPYQTILYDLRENVLTVTMNRPDVYNAFNEQMKDELNDAFRKAGQDQNVRALVLRGAGGKAFSSGQDLKEHQGQKRSLKESLEKSYNPLIRKMRSLEKPIIAMINGVAAGAGLSVALACDLRIMSAEAKLIQAFIRIGLVPDSGAHWFLPRLAGMARAFEYAVTGRDVTADEAERVGLVNRVVPAAELEGETRKIAGELAKAPTRAIGLIKRALNKASTATLDEILDYEAYIQQIASETEDHREGVEAFLAKRPARFSGM